MGSGVPWCCNLYARILLLMDFAVIVLVMPGCKYLLAYIVFLFQHDQNTVYWAVNTITCSRFPHLDEK